MRSDRNVLMHIEQQILSVLQTELSLKPKMYQREHIDFIDYHLHLGFEVFKSVTHCAIVPVIICL